MHPILRNILAVVAGAILGSVANMCLVTVGPSLIPPPEGAIVTTLEGLKASLHLFEPKHFIFPFLAHAVGTLVGAFAAALIAASHKMRFAYGIGCLFMVGGIANIFMLPGPVWFNALDVIAAYLPMAFLAGQFALRFGKNK
jgi:hypothetical protein